MTNCDEDQRLVVGGVEQVPRGMWRCPTASLCALAGGHHAGNAALRRAPARRRANPATPTAGSRSPTPGAVVRAYPAVLVTCQSWLLTTQIECDESLFSHKLWTALDRTRYMQSSKTFVMVDRPFWKDRDPTTGRDVMSMTLTDRLTRGTYLFDNGDDQPGVICLTVLLDERRAENAAAAGRPAGPAGAGRAQEDLPRRRHREPHHRRPDHCLLGGRPALPSARSRARCPGTTGTTSRMYSHFMQDDLPPDSGAFSSPVTTSPGRRPGSRVPSRPR